MQKFPRRKRKRSNSFFGVCAFYFLRSSDRMYLQSAFNDGITPQGARRIVDWLEFLVRLHNLKQRKTLLFFFLHFFVWIFKALRAIRLANWDKCSFPPVFYINEILIFKTKKKKEKIWLWIEEEEVHCALGALQVTNWGNERIDWKRIFHIHRIRHLFIPAVTNGKKTIEIFQHISKKWRETRKNIFFIFIPNEVTDREKVFFFLSMKKRKV